MVVAACGSCSPPTGSAAAIASARREAEASFKDGTVFLERWLEKSRHIEIQILGDRHGNLVHLFERECSIQRRHQKIIEEAPSPVLDAELREQMGQAALQAAHAIGYHSAGTAEFLVAGREFFFLEVNTRLQVEHPVTEAITGLDLVREQIRVAEGEHLGFSQSDLRIQGHAIEARVCAENPAKNFLPAPGKVDVWEPAQGPGLRYDAGIESGSEIGVEFDPMIAKVIAHGPTRREAAARLARALEQTRIQGITHNRDFLVATLRSDAFLAGDTTTDFIARVAPATQREPGQVEAGAVVIGAALQARAMRRERARVLQTLPGGFRNSVMPPEQVRYRLGEETLTVRYRALRDGTFSVTLDGQGGAGVGSGPATPTPRAVRVHATAADGIELAIDGHRHGLKITVVGDRCLVHGADGDIELVELPRHPLPERARSRGGLVAPMPGKVLSIAIQEGARVEAGQLLLILEAMKMEHRITAPVAGVVQALRVQEGEQVANGALLVRIEPTTDTQGLQDASH